MDDIDIHIAVIYNHPETETAPLIGRYLENRGIEWDIYRGYEGEHPDMEDYDAVIAGGSPYFVREHRDDEWLKAEEEFFRDLYKPGLGICFAHQLIAEAYGGYTDKAVGYEKCRGPNRVYVDNEIDIFRDLPETVLVAEFHSDEVIIVPDDFHVIASSDICRVEAMKHKSKPLYTFQFHPEWEELMKEYGEDNTHGYTILDNFIEIVKNYREERVN